MLAQCVAEFAGKHVWPVYRSLHGQLRNIKKFALGQAKVRRALANVPTYMIFDDHDVTDDWNLNPEWCKRVFASRCGAQAAARPTDRAQRAGFVRACSRTGATTSCATPRARPGSGAGPGSGPVRGRRPVAAQGRRATSSIACSAWTSCRSRSTPTRPHGRHAAVDAPMRWHYTVEGPQFTVAVLDNRTRRGFASKFGPPGNVGTTMIDAQVPSAPLPAGQEVLIVVAPLQVLAPSVFDEIVAPGAYRAFDLGTPGKIGVGRGGEAMPGLNPDAIESWALDAITFEALTARLAPHRKVVLLSGDVHNSTATQMSYWRKGEALPSRILQFTCSGFKNVMPSYLTLIDQSLAFAQELIRVDLGGDRMGWLDGADGAFTFPPGQTERDVPIVLRKRIQQRPAHLPTYGWPTDAVAPGQRPGGAHAGACRQAPGFLVDAAADLRPALRHRARATGQHGAPADGAAGAVHRHAAVAGARWRRRARAHSRPTRRWRTGISASSTASATRARSCFAATSRAWSSSAGARCSRPCTR